MTLTPPQRFDILQRDNFTCRFCGREAPETLLEVDHVKPSSKGGSDDPSNLVTACRDCNRGKGDRLVDLSKPEDWAKLVGKFFHICDSEGFIANQGLVLAEVAEAVYMVELYEFLMGRLGDRRLYTLDDMLDPTERWIFYRDDEDMRDAYDHGPRRRRLPRDPDEGFVLKTAEQLFAEVDE